MPRTANLERKVRLCVWLREEIRARMDLRLFSPEMGKIPYGAHSDLVNAALAYYLDKLEAGDKNVQP